MIGLHPVGAAPLGAPQEYTDAGGTPPGGAIDVDSIPSSRRVVFEGSLRVVMFEGSIRVVVFDGSDNPVE